MSMALGGKGGVKSDINVTPLVDVMLVLLIIMMLIAPMMQNDVPVTLPEADHSGDKPATQEQTVIAISAGREIYLNAQPVATRDLLARVNDALRDKKDKIILIKADKDVDYGTVMQAMDQLREGGIEDIGLITDPKKDPNSAAGGR